MNIETNISSSKRPYGSVMLVVRSRDGLIKHWHRQNMHSLTANFWRILHGAFNNTSVTVDHINGGTLNYSGLTRMRCISDGSNTTGIVIGSGNTPMELDDRDLDDRIIHGSDPGELLYQVSNGARDPNNRQCVFDRVFENASGGDVTVREATLCCSANTGNNNSVVIARDVLDSDVVVADTDILTVTYTMEFHHGMYNMQGWSSEMCDQQHSIREIDGTNFNTDAWKNNIAVVEDFDDVAGIELGTGDDPPDFDDRNINEIIEDGTGDGELEKSNAASLSALDINTTSLSFEVTRRFTNRGSTDIVIVEAGLFGEAGAGAILDHRLYDSPYTLEPGRSIIARWAFNYEL